jgi:hypothetical protein
MGENAKIMDPDEALNKSQPNWLLSEPKASDSAVSQHLQEEAPETAPDISASLSPARYSPMNASDSVGTVHSLQASEAAAGPLSKGNVADTSDSLHLPQEVPADASDITASLHLAEEVPINASDRAVNLNQAVMVPCSNVILEIHDTASRQVVEVTQTTVQLEDVKQRSEDCKEFGSPRTEPAPVETLQHEDAELSQHALQTLSIPDIQVDEHESESDTASEGQTEIADPVHAPTYEPKVAQQALSGLTGVGGLSPKKVPDNSITQSSQHEVVPSLSTLARAEPLLLKATHRTSHSFDSTLQQILLKRLESDNSSVTSDDTPSRNSEQVESRTSMSNVSTSASARGSMTRNTRESLLQGAPRLIPEGNVDLIAWDTFRQLSERLSEDVEDMSRMLR